MSTNARALTRYGIQFRWPPTKILPGGIQADWLRDGYLTQLLALDGIAEQADVSRSTIRRALAFNEIRRARRQGMHPSTPRSPHPHGRVASIPHGCGLSMSVVIARSRRSPVSSVPA